jgi:hypothetical protein
MKTTFVTDTIIHIPELLPDNAHDPDPRIGPRVRVREVVLQPKVYQGRRVMAAYDRATDTLFVRDAE